MKKLFLFIVTIIAGFLLQSCTFNTTTYFHKDKTTSILADLDVSELMSTVKSMGGDSLAQNKELKFADLTRTWQSLYDFQKEKGKVSKDPDSIKMMKKIFMKGNFNKDDEFSGFSLKINNATEKEINGFYTALERDEMANAITKTPYSNWDGKQLEINTQLFKIEKPKADDIDDPQNPKSALSGMTDMISIKYKNTLVFDSKIKSIEGKHDWVKQIDDKSIVIEYDSKDAANPDYSFTNKDQKIIIKLK